MSFFDPQPPAPTHERHPQPVWSQSPSNELGVGVPLRIALVRTPEIALLIDQVVAYSTGFSLRLSIRVHPDRDEPTHVMPWAPGPDSEGRLLLGVQFSDGRKGANDRLGGPETVDPAVAAPVIRRGGGGGGGGRYDLSHWVWPLPPPGPLAFVCRWSDQGIDETRVEVDAGPILEAADRSELLWPEASGNGGSRWTVADTT